MITGNEAAFPSTDTLTSDGLRCDPLNTGLTIRQHFAAMAMQGILSGYYSNEKVLITVPGLAEDAVRYADALIDELNKQQ